MQRDDELRDAARRAVRHLDRVGWSIAVGDSVTGGLLAQLIELAPRGARCFAGGVVTHPHPNQGWLVGVDSAEAVDESSARSMAEKVQWMFDADVGIGIVGDGATWSGVRHPRSVYVGWSGPVPQQVPPTCVRESVGNDARRACLAVFDLIVRSAGASTRQLRSA